MTYLMKVSFDTKDWYQLEWNDVEFKKFSECGKDCKNISELNSKILESFPHSNLKYKLIKK